MVARIFNNLSPEQAGVANPEIKGEGFHLNRPGRRPGCKLGV